MATAGIAVSVSMGVMKPLLSKLTTLMGDKYKKLKGMRKQVSFLKDELTAMDAFLENLELMGDDLDPSAKHWRSNVREMAYDIEDCIDDFFQKLESKAGPSESEGFVKKAVRSLRKLRVRHRIASQIDELKARVLEAGEQRKRYLIVVDDLWDVPSWEIIKCVFPENGKHSRVIVTTRHQDVAMSCSSDKGDIHYMKPLSDQDSRKLFNNRIFDSEDSCPPQFIDVSREILKKCGGLPLSIITVASILACRPTRLKEEWEHIQDCLLSSQAPPTNSTLADMMHILDLSYKFLPRHLKACFLYLGTYPEDHQIDKDELVRKWVAEGFVSGPSRRVAWDVAECYLNELVNRSMIQPAYKRFGIIEVTYYKVHDMMLDLILKRCREDNFIRLVHEPQAVAEVYGKVRRLTVHTAADVTIGRQLSQVLSVSLFRAKCVPPLSELRFLRVLFLLWFSSHEQRIDLTCISQLSQLRYLKVACYSWGTSCDVVLPNHVRSMHCLETLEIQRLDVSSIPPDIVDLPCLCHLIVSNSNRKMLPDGIGKVKTLRTLSGFRLPTDSSDALMNTWVTPPFPFLEELDVEGWTFSRVPRWIGGLHNLRRLVFGVEEVSNLTWDDVGTMGMLPNLRILILRV